MATNHHTNEILICPKCEDTLKTAHPDLIHWFWTFVKPRHLDCHVSEAWRNEYDQRLDYASGKSKEAWPMSKHNKMDEEGNPCSLALDLFQLASNDLGCFPWNYFKAIADETKDVLSGYHINWGGDFPKLHDGPHFELIQPIEEDAA